MQIQIPPVLTVAQALVFAKTSSIPFEIKDTNAAIAANAHALAALGDQLVDLLCSSPFTDSIHIYDLIPLLNKFIWNGVNNAVTFTNINYTVTVAQFLLYDQAVGPFIIQDSNAAIAANADALAAMSYEISSLQGDGPLFNYSISESDANALANMTYYNGKREVFTNVIHIETVAKALVDAQTSSVPFIIQDSNAAIAANADALASLGAQLVWLQGSGSTFDNPVSAANLLALAAKTYSYGNMSNTEVFTTVFDTAAHIAANATALQNYAAGLASKSNGLAITINDTAANIAGNATALQAVAAGQAQDSYYNGPWGQVYANNNSLTLTINDSAANIASNATALQTLATALTKDIWLYGFSNSNRLTLTVNDTAANIANNASTLQALAAGLAQDTYGVSNTYYNNNLLNISINDTAANIASNATALQTMAAKLAQDTYASGFHNNNRLTLTVNDTATNIARNATALQTLATKLTQATYDAGQVNLNSLSLTINDSAANIASNTTALQTLAATLTNDTYTSYIDTYSDQQPNILNNNSFSLTINDTAANIARNATALQTLAAKLAQDTYNYSLKTHNNNSLSLRQTSLQHSPKQSINP